MSQKERNRLAVLVMLEQGQISHSEAARRMGVTARHGRRLYRRWQAQGDQGLIHQARGNPSNRAADPDLQHRALALIRTHYPDFGPTLATEMLLEDHGLQVHPETLRRWMRQAGLLSYQRSRRKYRSCRPRRSHYGRLVQIDTCIHPWLEGRGEPMVLIAMIDDATSRLWACFYPGDGTQANMALMRDYIARFGRPEAIYCDRATHFIHDGAPDAEQSYRGERARTQIGRALDELDIRLIPSRSPQAKGRIERSFRTMQDRLVKGLRLAGARTIREANAYLMQTFIAHWNGRFAVEPTEKGDVHRSAQGLDLDAIFSVQEWRTVGHDYTVQFGGTCWQLQAGCLAAGVTPQAKVVVERRLDGVMKLRFEGHYLEFKLVKKQLKTRGAAGAGVSVGLRPPSTPAPAIPESTPPRPLAKPDISIVVPRGHFYCVSTSSYNNNSVMCILQCDAAPLATSLGVGWQSVIHPQEKLSSPRNDLKTLFFITELWSSHCFVFA